MSHPEKIEYPGNLVEDIGNLRYDALEKFLKDLSEKIYKDACKDSWRNREQLAGKLFSLYSSLLWASQDAGQAWKICEPYMKDKSE